MIIYKDTFRQFATDIRENTIVLKMENQFKAGFGRNPVLVREIPGMLYQKCEILSRLVVCRII